MKILGLITEYNPFHLGHILHLNKAKELVHPDLTVVVMSGNIVQRGTWAIVDKCTRAQCAIEHGIDLVLELPFIYTNQQADIFAQRSIDILAALNVTDIVFGSECNQLELLQQVANLPININHLKENLATGSSYAASLTYGSTSFASNDILGIAYLKALKKHPGITPHCIERTNCYLSDELTEISSAKAIRNAYYQNIDISMHTPLANAINDYQPSNWNDYYPILKHQLINTQIKDLQNIFLVSEGIEKHLQKCILESSDFSSFLQLATTRRYTSARIQRICMNIINHVSKDIAKLINETIIHPLAFNDFGKAYLNKLEISDTNILIMNRLNQLANPLKDLWINVERNYYLFHPQINPLCLQGPIYIKKTETQQ